MSIDPQLTQTSTTLEGDEVMSGDFAANWYPDPTGRNQLRYWDGAAWTGHIVNNGTQGLDPLPATPAPVASDATANPSWRQARRAKKEARVEQARLERARTEHEKQERIAREREAQIEAQRQAHARQQERLELLAAKQAAAEHARRVAEEREARLFQLPWFILPGRGYPNTEVAGEFARMAEIHAALGRRPRLDEEIVDDAATALLAPEPLNPYDGNAVRVIINRRHVGYLERELAATMQPALLRIVDAGYLPAVPARLWASARLNYDDGRKLQYYANVRVALSDINKILPFNDPPRGEYGMLPWAGTLQVTGEEHHQDVLSNYVSVDGECIAIGTLAILPSPRAHGKDVVEVRIDGERIGQLTPVTSQHFIPTITHLDEQGLGTAAWLTVTGNTIAAQVTMHAERAHVIPPEWFERPYTVPRLHGSTAELSDAAADDAEIRTAMREPMWDEP